MRTQYLIVLILFSVFLSCNSKKNTIVFKHQKDISLKIPEGKKLPYSIYFDEKDNRLTAFYQGNELVNYNFKTKEIIDSIPLKVPYYQDIILLLYWLATTCQNDEDETKNSIYSR